MTDDVSEGERSLRSTTCTTHKNTAIFRRATEISISQTRGKKYTLDRNNYEIQCNLSHFQSDEQSAISVQLVKKQCPSTHGLMGSIRDQSCGYWNELYLYIGQSQIQRHPKSLKS